MTPAAAESAAGEIIRNRETGGTLVNFSLLSNIFSGKLVSMSALSPSLVMILALDKLSGGQIVVTD